jgi:oligopeptidase B
MSQPSPAAASHLPAQPPTARREPTSTTLHGVTLHDDYRWMRDKNSPELLAYLNAENAYTSAFMAPTADLQAKLYAEMLSHIKETDESVPYRLGDWFYYSRTLEGRQYPIYCRRAATNPDLDAPFELSAQDPAQPEQVILDVNALAEGNPFMAVGAMAISPDGNLLAYTTDSTGFRQYTLHLRSYDPALRTWTDLPDTALRVGTLAWAADSRTLFYSTEDETTKRQDHIFRHSLGAAPEQDALVLHEPDERFNVGVGRTRDGLYLLIESASHTTNEFRFLPADDPTGDFRVLAPRLDDQEYYPAHRFSPETGGLFYIRTNDAGKNFRVVTAPVADPGRDHWSELIPLDPDHPLEDFDLFQSFAVTTRRKLGLPTLEVLRFTDKPRVPHRPGRVPQMSGSPASLLAGVSNSRLRCFHPHPPAHPHRLPRTHLLRRATHVNRIFSTQVFRYSYQSLVSPPSVYEYNVARHSDVAAVPIGSVPAPQAAGGPRRLLTPPSTPPNASGSTPRVAHPFRLHRTIPVPVSNGLKPRPPPPRRYQCRGPRQLRWWGRQIPSTSTATAPMATRCRSAFSPMRLSLARPRRRYGLRSHPRRRRAWRHLARRRQNGRPSATPSLTSSPSPSPSPPTANTATPTRVAIEGGSAGGLLMGAVLNMRPDLFRVVLSHVPFVDIMNTMLDATLPLTVAEYEEWGNPNEPEAFATMLSYSPYDNLEQLANASIPAILVKTSLNDSQVMYWEPAKYVAKLRTLKTNATPLLLHINMDAGHGGASGRYDYLKEIAFDYAFLLTQLAVVTT